MLTVVRSSWPLLLGIMLLMVGNGMQGTLLGVRGDAIYTTELPQWSLPVERGGGDDGKIGRMRLQGWLDGPIKTPLTEADRNTLRQKAAARGVDGAFSDHEFTTPGDNSSYEIDMEGAEA